jgi:hypothetical protein
MKMCIPCPEHRCIPCLESIQGGAGVVVVELHRLDLYIRTQMSTPLPRYVVLVLGLVVVVATAVASCSSSSSPQSNKQDTVIKPPPSSKSDTAADARTLFPLHIGNLWEYTQSWYDERGEHITKNQPFYVEVVDTLRVHSILTYAVVSNGGQPHYYFYADSGRKLRYFSTAADTGSIGVLIAPYLLGDSVLLTPGQPVTHDTYTTQYFYGFETALVGSESIRCNVFEIFQLYPPNPPTPAVLSYSRVTDYAPGIGPVLSWGYRYNDTSRTKIDRLELQKYTVH